MFKPISLLRMKFIIFIVFIFFYSNAFSETNTLNMEFQKFDFSLLNNGLFILPPLLWNIVFFTKTPSYYSSGTAPSALLMTENILRATTFLTPFFIPINTDHTLYYPGLTVYSIGLGVYFSSWLLLMFFPDLEISSNSFMRLIPAITPIIWLVGIGMMSEIPISYSVLSTGFVATHVGEYLFRFNIININY